MKATEHRKPEDAAVSWRRVLADLAVTYVWAYDTVAILDDYYDSQPGILPAGQLIRFSGIADVPHYLICGLDDVRLLERTQLTIGRILRFRPWSVGTRLQAIVSATDYEALTIQAERPTRWQRLVRRLAHAARP